MVIKKPYEVIKFDKLNDKIELPRLTLKNRALQTIGIIPKYTNWNCSLVGNGLDEITFDVAKYIGVDDDGNDIICPVWDDLIDLKIVEVSGYGCFEISVNYTDNTKTMKSIHGISLETELGQILLHDFHVNDDEDTSTYTKDADGNKIYNHIPTVFYNPEDPQHSLLHRALEKAPHWSFDYVTPYIALDEDYQPELSKTFQRTYTEDGTSIYDFFTGTVAEESNVIFVFNTFERKISVYNLCDCIEQNGGEKIESTALSLNATQYSDHIRCDNIFEITNLSITESGSMGYISCILYDIDKKEIKRTDNITKPVTIETTNTYYVRLIYLFSSGSATDITYKTYNNKGDILASAIGEDTTVLVSKEKLANEITISSNKDEVKNCFRVEGGDDVISDLVRAVNMNGSNYIYHCADFQYNDMSNELAHVLKEYQEDLSAQEDNYYGENGIYTRLCKVYEDLLWYESSMMPDVSIEDTTAEEQYNLVVEQLTNNKVAVSSLSDYNETYFSRVTNNVEEMANIYVDARYEVSILEGLSYNYVDNASSGTWTGNIQVKRAIDDTDCYPIAEENIDDKFDITIIDDETGLAYTKQKIEKALAKGSMLDVDFDVAEMDEDKIREYFDQYGLNRLKSFAQGYDSCLSELMKLNDTSTVRNELYQKYLTRLRIITNPNPTPKFPDIGLLEIRQSQVDDINKDIESITKEQEEFQKKWNFESYLLGIIDVNLKGAGFTDYIKCRNYLDITSFIEGNTKGSVYCYLYDEDKNQIDLVTSITSTPTVIDTSNAYYIRLFYSCAGGTIANIKCKMYYNNNKEDLYKEFCAYRREDTYQNSNYISDGNENSTTDLLSTCKELIDVATKEIKKACVLQRTISCSLNNLFAIPEFEPLYEKFALYNYIRIRTEDEILKLRLIGVDFSGDSVSEIEVTFAEQIESVDGKISETQSILQQASAIATSFSSTALQAKQGAEAQSTFTEIYNKGLNAANTMLTNNDNNEITITPSGILCRRMDDKGYYGSKQLRITGNIMAFTDNDWQTVKMAIGETTFINPDTGKEITDYGILAPNVIGELMASERMYISNENGSVKITGEGITLDGGTITWTSPIKQDAVEGLDDSLSNFVEKTVYKQDMSELQDQIDGNITTWFYDGEPTLESVPASDWVTGEDKNTHLGDLYYDNQTGYAYRFQLSNSVYSWIKITDTDITKALSDAAKAQDTADSKRRVFYEIPTVPYDQGDLWAQGEDGELMICINSKSEGDYAESDWDKASKYTDDTKANEVESNLNAYKKEINEFQGNVNAALTGSSTTEIGNDYIISPKIGGGYLYIADTRDGDDNTSTSIEINPNGTSFDGHNSDYVFNVSKDNEIVMGVDNDGNGYFKGSIYATDGEFTGNINANQLTLTDKNDNTEFGFIDIGKMNKDNVLHKGVGLICNNYTNGYVTLGHKDSAGGTKPCYILDVDDNVATHNFYYNTYFNGGTYYYGGTDTDGNDIYNSIMGGNNAIYCSGRFVVEGTAGTYSGAKHFQAADANMTTTEFNKVFPNDDVWYYYQEFGNIVVAGCSGTISNISITVNWFPTPVLGVEDCRVADNGTVSVRGYLNANGLTIKNLITNSNSWFSLNFVYVKKTS